MIEFNYSFRVNYPDADQMGTVHHSNYAKYYETARWELFRSMGISYKTVEEAGYLLPVIHMEIRFIKPIHYDEMLIVKTTLKNLRGARIWFSYRLYNDKDELVNEAETELASVYRNNWRPCILPGFLVKAIEKNNTHEIACA